MKEIEHNFVALVQVLGHPGLVEPGNTQSRSTIINHRFSDLCFALVNGACTFAFHTANYGVLFAVIDLANGHEFCVVVVAGMEGALPSVVGGLVAVPVIAVPTSIGYGASFGGVAPLLTMLNSCASGVSVVNIDNGFAGGYTAALINRLAVEGCPAK